MRIVCPSCEAEYDVPDTMLGRARTVRCAKCAREWAPFAAPPPAPPMESFAEMMAAEPEPEARAPAAPPAAGTLADQAPPIVVPKRMREPKVPGGPPGVGLVIGWLITGAIVLAGMGALVLKRPEVVAFWPPARRLYILLGLDF